MINIVRIFLERLFPFESNRKKLAKLIDNGVLEIADYTYQWQSLQIDTYAGSNAKVKIGKFCSISKNIRIITGGIHPTNWVSTYPFRAQFNLPGKNADGMPTTKGDIIIGNDVWIGTGVTILSGVKIGDGAVITAGAVVTKDIPEYSIAGGVPAKVIKFRFTEEQILSLKAIEWWDWDEEKILKHVDYLSSDNVDMFITSVINKTEK